MTGGRPSIPFPAPAPGEQWEAYRYRGRGLRIGRNSTVHRVAEVEDERGFTIPAPDCRTGWYAAGRPWWQVYTPTDAPVTCRSCLSRVRAAEPPSQPGRPSSAPGQLALLFAALRTFAVFASLRYQFGVVLA